MERTAWSWGINVVMAMFPLVARPNILRYFDSIETSLDTFRITEDEIRLVAYATIRAESGDFTPRTEGESRFNTLKIPPELTPYGEATKYNLYELRNETKTFLGRKVSGLGNDRFGDGAKYVGRGFVQLTGKANYLKYG